MSKQNKRYLPSKICGVCDRPFTWRKKWKSNWDEVKYCSKKCSGKKKERFERFIVILICYIIFFSTILKYEQKRFH